MNGILIFGDSITAGRGVAKERSWASRLASSFDEKNKYDYIVYNLGILGESSSDLLGRLEVECQARIKKRERADSYKIVFAIGINDSKSHGPTENFNTPSEIFTQNISNLIKIASKYSGCLIFVGLTPVDENKVAQIEGVTFLNRYIKKYDNIIKDICEKRNIVFVNIFQDWLEKDYKKFLSDDGIHPNELGHQEIFLKVVQSLILVKSSLFDGFQILKQEYSLSEEDIKVIKYRFTESKIFNSPLFLGQFFEERPEAVFGGLCIRKDIEGICLNTFYQAFMPLKVASVLKTPCKIILPTKEEIFLQPKLSQQYTNLGIKLEKGIMRFAKNFEIATQPINTATQDIDEILAKCTRDLNIDLSEEDSRYLFTLSLIKPHKPKHFKKRILTNKRVIAGHSSCFFNRVSGLNKFLIVEDIEQHNCALYAKKFELGKGPNFLTFLPLPNIFGTAPMFKSEKEGRLLLGQDKNYYFSLWTKSPDWVLWVFREFLKLVDGRKNILEEDFEWFFEIIKKISSYFEEDDPER